jgi:hypothetical protein
MASSKIHVTIHGSDRDSMADLVRFHGIRVYPQTLTEHAEGFEIDAVVSSSSIRQLVDAGYEVDQHEDVDEVARESLQYVGQGNRYAAAAAAAEGEAP